MLARSQVPMRAFIITMLLSMMMVTTVTATSWGGLEPEEVNDKAEVIVLGTYDFSSKPISSQFIFQGVVFNVKSVYRGDVSEQLIAGIDVYDASWAEEFQSEDGEFLLFLEKSDQANFLTPVAGPNGMI